MRTPCRNAARGLRFPGRHVFRTVWRWFWGPTARFGWGLILIAGGFLGVIFWGGFNTFMEYTNTMEFCISCHEMEQLVFREYKESTHYSNPSGVRVVCSDCHVPKDWAAKLLRKIKVSNELYHKVIGTIDTPEKFEQKRLALAEHVWSDMLESDSRECRNCHSYTAMKHEGQKRRAANKMRAAAKKGETCIECHKGIAHKLPKGYGDDEDEDDDDD